MISVENIYEEWDFNRVLNFYDEQNLKAFREEYADMPIHEKAMENMLLIGSSASMILLFIIGLLIISGVIY